MCAPQMATHYKVIGQVQSMARHTVVVQGLKACHRDVGHIIKGRFETFPLKQGRYKNVGRRKRECRSRCWIVRYYKGGDS